MPAPIIITSLVLFIFTCLFVIYKILYKIITYTNKKELVQSVSNKTYRSIDNILEESHNQIVFLKEFSKK